MVVWVPSRLEPQTYGTIRQYAHQVISTAFDPSMVALVIEVQVSITLGQLLIFI